MLAEARRGAKPWARVQTTLGDIVLEHQSGQGAAARPPTSCATWTPGHYDDGSFHRTVKMDNQPESAIRSR